VPEPVAVPEPAGPYLSGVELSSTLSLLQPRPPAEGSGTAQVGTPSLGRMTSCRAR